MMFLVGWNIFNKHLYRNRKSEHNNANIAAWQHKSPKILIQSYNLFFKTNSMVYGVSKYFLWRTLSQSFPITDNIQ